MLSVALVSAVACGPGAAEPDAVVTVGHLAFGPSEVTIPTGGSVRWEFEDGGLLHQVGAPGEFDSGVTGAGSFTHTFERPGVYEYTCSVHRYMVGAVTVTDD
ncbi:biphenyl 2,3-dioxygenase [Rhodococcus triatomae]|nr:plastocyanin/azurin family copper-binding protein [Rhodococcus triatomae]QNG17850.1 biphenyl 2,3-dioxygenase [Rhodococcus triatomae]QNG22482.1 biphenyl 2,3-dioxygenase [Rhodococcus triatomae]